MRFFTPNQNIKPNYPLPPGKKWVWVEPGGALGWKYSVERAYWSPETYGKDGWWELRPKKESK